MRRVRLIHWKAGEAGELARLLTAAGYAVDYEARLDSRGFRAIREAPPDAFVIDLSRLPSHGREAAIFIRGSKALRATPIVFVDGAPGKIEAVRERLPDAAFTLREGLAAALQRALAHAPANPVVPAQMMDRYAGRGACEKLGIAADSRVAVIDPPANYVQVLGDLPGGVSFHEEGGEDCAVALWFVSDAAAYLAALPRMRNLAARAKLWIAWPKRRGRNASGLTPALIRESAAALGLVDYKICSLDQTWSALLFAAKKSPRNSSRPRGAPAR